MTFEELVAEFNKLKRQVEVNETDIAENTTHRNRNFLLWRKVYNAIKEFFPGI